MFLSLAPHIYCLPHSPLALRFDSWLLFHVCPSLNFLLLTAVNHYCLRVPDIMVMFLCIVKYNMQCLNAVYSLRTVSIFAHLSPDQLQHISAAQIWLLLPI